MSTASCIAVAGTSTGAYNICMKLQELENSISQLPPSELAKFREWFWEFDATNWDKQFDSDVAAGRLEALALEATRQHQAGKSTKL